VYGYRYWYRYQVLVDYGTVAELSLPERATDRSYAHRRLYGSNKY
jgi:hypothetical protein